MARRKRLIFSLMVMLPIFLGCLVAVTYTRSPDAAFRGLTQSLEAGDWIAFRRYSTFQGRNALFYSRENWLHRRVDERTRAALPPLRPLGAFLRRARTVRVTRQDDVEISFLVRFETGFLYHLQFLWTPENGWRLNNFYKEGSGI